VRRQPWARSHGGHESQLGHGLRRYRTDCCDYDALAVPCVVHMHGVRYVHLLAPGQWLLDSVGYRVRCGTGYDRVAYRLPELDHWHGPTGHELHRAIRHMVRELGKQPD